MSQTSAPEPIFVTSTVSGGNGNCVQVATNLAHVSGEIHVRDSKHPDAGTLVFTPAEWKAFLGGVAKGEFQI